MSALPCSSSSFPPSKFEYDIFLSFSGKDTRYDFTGHLDKALSDGGIKTFRDDKSLKIGKNFAPELLRAIGESRGSIVVFSQRYAFSRWCLDELVQIMKQREEWGHEVYPIFYHVEPSDLKYQLKAVKEAFDKHENGKRSYTKEKMQSWRHALFEVAELHGRTLREYKYESEFIVNIVEDIISAKSDAEINIEPQIEDLEEKLEEIRAVIDDAEEILFTDRSKSFKIELPKLKYLAYELEDVVDEFKTHIAIKFQGSSSKKPKLMNSDSYNTEFNKGILAKIKEANARVNNLQPKINQLQQRMTGYEKSKRMVPRLQPTSVEIETHVYGRDQDKETIIDLLLQNNDEGNFVIPIVGMGGIGKTTLVQLVYNDARVKNHFDLQAWVYVSDDFDVTRITRQMLESITFNTCNDNALNSLQVKLKERLSKKKFLIVLDDVWNEDYDHWTILQSPFLTRTPGSKIIVTTRNHSVSKTMGALQTHFLKGLSDDDSLSIFAQHALVPRDFRANPHFKEVAEKIVRKCDGLPLAAKILGGLLRTVDLNCWKKILDSEISPQSSVIPALQLSYHYLPPQLKRCFAYCSIFPKAYQFQEQEIILLWSAEGLLQEEQGKEEGFLLEVRGKECIKDMLSRSLLQKSDNSCFSMHDLVNDLAQSVAGEICIRKDGDLKKITKHTRHLSYLGREYHDIQKLKGIREAKHLRTILPIWRSIPYVYTLRPCLCQDSYNVLRDLRCLRVLSFKGYRGIKIFPDLFGDLKLLRYLDFSYTEIRSLPNSISTLYNLETLLLVGCRGLDKLPSMTENLVNLHHLNLTSANRLEGMPSNFGALTNLEFLSDFVVSKDKGYHIRELRDLSNLKGPLEISGLENVVETEDASQAKLHEKSGVDKLVLDWRSRIHGSLEYRIFENVIEEAEEKVLDFLEPSKQLKELVIMYYGGSMLAKWVGNSSLTNLESLHVINCRNCLSLPSLGKLPLLKKVVISGLDNVTSVGVEFLGGNTMYPFRALEVLQFEYMSQWKNWDFSEGDKEARKFPRFRKLLMRNCPELLGSLPKHLLSNLEELVIEGCRNLVIAIPSLPSLSELRIHGCEEVVYKGFEDHRSLQRISFDSISKLTCAVECGRLEKLSSTALLEPTCLRELVLKSCPNLISLSKNNLPLNVRRLMVFNCENLQLLFAEAGESSNMITCFIEEMDISDCPSLVSFSSEVELFTSLKRLNIQNCPKLEFVAQELFTSLERLVISSCPGLKYVAQEIQHNSSLESIRIYGCDNLEKLPHGLNKLSHLREIGICTCSNLICFPEGGLPQNLKDLVIGGANVYKIVMEWGIA